MLIPWHLIEKLDNGCWAWIGRLDRDGYGKWGNRSASRAIYEILKGPVPAGFELDHFVCNKRNCCNPEHQEPVTHKENIWRKLERMGKPQPR